MAQKLTIKDCEEIIRRLKESGRIEFCISCDREYPDNFPEGGKCSCDNDE